MRTNADPCRPMQNAESALVTTGPDGLIVVGGAHRRVGKGEAEFRVQGFGFRASGSGFGAQRGSAPESRRRYAWPPCAQTTVLAGLWVRGWREGESERERRLSTHNCCERGRGAPESRRRCAYSPCAQTTVPATPPCALPIQKRRSEPGVAGQNSSLQGDLAH